MGQGDVTVRYENGTPVPPDGEAVGGPSSNNSSAPFLSDSITLKAGVKLDIFQINSHKSKNSNIALRLHSEKFTNALYAVTEPYCDKYGNLKFIGSRGLKVIQSAKRVVVENQEAKEKVRAAIIHSNHLPVTPLQQFCSADMAVGMITYQPKGRAAWQKKTLCIVSSYWDIKRDAVPEELTAFIDHARKKNWDLQVHMDSNSHSTLFGSRDQNKRGDTLEEYLAQHGLIPMNVGSDPTFFGGTG